MTELHSNEARFRDIYERPTIQRMLEELNPYEFEDFIGYVFERAGFIVEDTATQFGPGLDLKLYTMPTPVKRLHSGVSIKQFQLDAKVVAPDVVKLRGGLADIGGVPGYMVTTSSLNEPARAQAAKEPRIWPLEGDYLLRFITYVRGTRSTPRNGSVQIAPTSSSSVAPLTPIPPEILHMADSIHRRAPRGTTVLAVANHKGGVGKTTTALNLAFGLAGQGHQVLLVDLDPQANLSQALPNPQADSVVPGHIGEYFAGRKYLYQLVRPTQFKHVWLIPSDHELSQEDRGIASGPEAELRFVKDLHASELIPPAVLDSQPFDWIILDTGPSMGFFTRPALAASHFVLMPIAPGAFADLGLHHLRQTIATMEALVGQPITLLASLVTQWKDDKLNNQLLANVRQELYAAGVPLLDTRIPLDKSHIEKAHIETGAGKKTNLLSHKSASASAYLKVIEEVLQHASAQGINESIAIKSEAETMTPKQRETKATEHLREILNLVAAKGDTVALSTALAEIAAEESRHNARFAEAIRARYQELLPQPKAKVTSRAKAAPKELPPLVPIRRIDGYRADPFSPPDPHFLIQLYGPSQLARALQDYTLDMLKETASKIQREHPGTKPTSLAKTDAVIKYIVKYSS